MAATDRQFSAALFASRQIDFPPMILFGEGVRLHYLYCKILGATASFARLERRAALSCEKKQ
ncbi:hypothetical protein [Rhizobium hidalgonense]|uniref:hypothetical protein n=1 Tax=Rhizobium hidalgonense TaxID=1538159 RepID=UPI0013E40113|nr:hypothetical protein [Rhizobium hidalgonense]